MNWYKKNIDKIAFPIQWREEDLQEIKSLLQKGNSLGQVSNLTGVPLTTLQKLNKKYRWVDFNEKRKEQDNFIASLYLLPPLGKGLSLIKIKKEYGFHQNSVKNALERLGLSEHLRDRIEAWTPSARSQHSRTMSDVMLNRWKDPAYRKNHSDKMVEIWKQWGGLEGFLLSRSSREKAIAHLNQFYGFLMSIAQDKNKINNVYNKYKIIIDNHSYPEDVNQVGTT